MLLFEINDAIKEGDGERLHGAYKLALLFYKRDGHTKYAYAVLLYLIQISALLPKAEAIDLKWNRFHNTSGGKGKNIPLDLTKEHQNKVLKHMWKALGPNLSEASATRMANSLEGLERILCSVDADSELQKRRSHRANKDPEESVMQILGDLRDKDVFTHTPGREGYLSFRNFKRYQLDNLDYRDQHKWMTDHIKMWSSIYE